MSMRKPILGDPTAAALARQLAEMERRLARVEQGQRSAQLGNSSVENGHLTFYDANGQVRQTLGKQNDGTFGLGAANGDPPPRPNTPTLVPSAAGINVHWNGQFFEEEPNDFLFVKVYLSGVDGFILGDSNYVGTLNREGYLPVGPLDYSPHYARFVAINTSGVESEPSLQGGPATPSRLLGSDLFPATITETEVADDSISTPKLQANSVTALKILAEAIEAYHIKAGVIEAQHLTAVLVLASRLVLGNPTGARLDIDDSGITQFSDLGDPTIRLGQNPQGGNYLTIVDPFNSQSALASISDEGMISATGLTVTGPFVYGGNELSTVLNLIPRGVIGICAVPASGDLTTATTTEIGIAELSVQTVQGRAYKIQAGPINAPDGSTGLRVRYTTDGTRPTLSSPSFATAIVQQFRTGDLTFIHYPGGVNPPDTGAIFELRLLMTVVAFNGTSTRAQTPGNTKIRFSVEDIGKATAFTGGTADGGGGGTATPKQYNTKWNATWTRGWKGSKTSTPLTDDMLQGQYSGNMNWSMIGFDDANIRSVLSGATIDAISIRLGAYHWYYSSGGIAVVGVHNTSSPPSSYTRTGVGQAEASMAKPEIKWIGLSKTVGEAFRDNTVKGIVLDAEHKGTSLTYYGRFRPAGHSSGPILSITYTK